MTAASPDPALTRLEHLSSVLDGVAAQLAAVAGREARTRKITWALAVSLVLDVALTIVVTVLTFAAIHDTSAVRTAQAGLHASQLAACAAGNQSHAEQRQLWGHVIAQAAAGPGSNKTGLDQFQAYINRTFAPVDCAKLSP